GRAHTTDTPQAMSPGLGTGRARRPLSARDLSELDPDREGTPDPLRAAPAAIAPTGSAAGPLSGPNLSVLVSVPPFQGQTSVLAAGITRPETGLAMAPTTGDSQALDQGIAARRRHAHAFPKGIPTAFLARTRSTIMSRNGDGV